MRQRAQLRLAAYQRRAGGLRASVGRALVRVLLPPSRLPAARACRSSATGWRRARRRSRSLLGDRPAPRTPAMVPASTVQRGGVRPRPRRHRQPVPLGGRPLRGDAGEPQLPHDEPGPGLPRPARPGRRLRRVRPGVLDRAAAAGAAGAGPAAGRPVPRRPRRRLAGRGHRAGPRGRQLRDPGAAGHRQVADDHQPGRGLRGAREARAVRLPEAGRDRRRPRPAAAAGARRAAPA